MVFLTLSMEFNFDARKGLPPWQNYRLELELEEEAAPKYCPRDSDQSLPVAGAHRDADSDRLSD